MVAVKLMSRAAAIYEVCAISDSSLILFTTTTLDPYLSDEKLFEHCPTVLHLSLRDICVNVDFRITKHCR